MSNSSKVFASYEPVSPVDIVDGPKPRGVVGYSEPNQKNPFTVARSRTSSSSSSLSLKPPRTPRFAEATSVNSPIGPSETGRSPFADPSPMAETQPPRAAGVSDVGFGYIGDNDPTVHSSFPVEQHANYLGGSDGPKSPLKSALKSPGTPGRYLNPLSPTFKEEQILEKQEGSTDVQQAKDLKVKYRVRLAKMVLRGTNFSCSLIVLAMLSSTFTIFNATKAIPPRNNLPPWAHGTNPWPQIVLLCIAGVSLVFSVGIFYAYWKGGHKRAEKAAVYYTVFSVFFFAFSIIMWAVGAGILHQSKQNGNGQDVWGWACKDNKRRTLFQDDVHYSLICRLQDWSLICCFIEIIVETITIAIYAIVFYRFYSKRKLRKSMDVRDKARSDLYLAQLRTQSAPNTPGFAQTPRTPHFPSTSLNPESDAEEGNAGYYSTQYVSPKHESTVVSSPKPFQLQPPPIKVHGATPKQEQDGFEPAMPQHQDTMREHVPAAPGEQQYDAVPIPGAYASPLTSPAFTPAGHGSMAAQMARGPPGQAM